MTAGRRRTAHCDGTSVSSHRSRATCYPLPAKLCFLIKSIVKERLARIPRSPPFSVRSSPIPFSHAALRKSRSYVRECLRRVTVARGQNRELSKFIRLSHSLRGISYFASFLLLLSTISNFFFTNPRQISNRPWIK